VVVDSLIAGLVFLLGLAEVYAALWLLGMIMVVVGTFLDALVELWKVLRRSF
jgi:hypothetical protein